MSKRASAVTVRSAATGAVVVTRLEIADGWWTRLVGLMLRRSLPREVGLLIEPCTSIHMMFMRFPIDAVFLGKPTAEDAQVRPVVAVHRDLRAWTGLVPFVRGAHGVLELPVGTIDASATAVGDEILLE